MIQLYIKDLCSVFICKGARAMYSIAKATNQRAKPTARLATQEHHAQSSTTFEFNREPQSSGAGVLDVNMISMSLRNP